MVVMCCVKGCRSESYAGCGISFHIFPKDEKMRRKWLELVPAKNLKYAKVCGKHFQRDNFVWANSRQTLKPDAVPSIFEDISRINKRWIDADEESSCSHSPGTSQDSSSMVFEQETDSSSDEQERDSPSGEQERDSPSGEEEIESPSDQLPAERSNLKDVAVQTGHYSSPAEADLRQKVKVLQQRLNRRTARIQKLKSILKSRKSPVSDPTYIVYVSK